MIVAAAAGGMVCLAGCAAVFAIASLFVSELAAAIAAGALSVAGAVRVGRWVGELREVGR